jgi:hypothetical protein
MAGNAIEQSAPVLFGIRRLDANVAFTTTSSIGITTGP